MAESEQPILEVQNLRISFHSEKGVKHAVKGISLSLKSAEILGIAGESGSGKSVTALSLLGLLEGNNVRIEVDKILFGKENTEISRGSASVRKLRGKRIGMIFQEPMSSLNPVMKCGAQVGEVLKAHTTLSSSAVKARVLELFKKVKLQNPQRICESYPHQLSGGQKQRVMIAQAIAPEPELLIADEPTTALDVSVQKSVLDLILSLQQEMKMAVIFISHDLNVLKYLSHRILIMRAGAILEQGRPTEVLENPQHPYTKALLAAKPPIHETLERLPLLSDYEKDRGFDIKKVAVPKDFSDAVNILEAKNISVKFPGKKDFLGRVRSHFTAVENVSFGLKKGEILGLVGESGSGKTSLGRSILQLIDYEGKYLFKGKKIIGDKAFRRSVQIIFQDPYSSLNPRRPVGSAIEEVLQFFEKTGGKEAKKKRAIELLKSVGLSPEHYYRYPHEFSGGQKQRICIARALAAEPELLICDESVSALDVSVQAQILNLLKDLREEFNLSMIFISHDLSVIRFISDRIAVMQKGEIVEINETAKLFENPQTSYTENLLSSLV